MNSPPTSPGSQPTSAGSQPTSPGAGRPSQCSRQQSLSSNDGRPNPSNMPSIDQLTLNPKYTCMVNPRTPGKLGLNVTAYANFFPINIANCQDLVSYTYECDQKAVGGLSKTRVTRRCASLLMKHHNAFKSAASNYKDQFYSLKSCPLVELDQTSKIYNVDYYEVEEPGPREGKKRLLIPVRLIKSTTHSLNQLRDHFNSSVSQQVFDPGAVVAIFNALLDRAISENKNIATLARRTKFFDIANKSGRHNLGGGLEAYKGFFKSVRACTGGLFLNLNSSAGAFFKEIRLDKLIAEIGIPQAAIIKLRGTKVGHSYTGVRRVKTIANFAPSVKSNQPPTANNVQFKCPTHGGMETVEDHYAKTYPNTKRENREALVLDLGNGVFVPSDLLYMLPAQPIRGLLSADQTAKMIEHAVRKPYENRKFILNEGIPAFQFGTNDGPGVRFNVSWNTGPPVDMTRVQARRLPVPQINPARTPQEMDSGSWNMKHKKFNKDPSAPRKVTYIELRYDGEPSCKNVEGFIDAIRQGMANNFNNKKNVIFEGSKDAEGSNKHSFVMKRDATIDELGPALRNLLERIANAGFSLLFAILPDQGQQNYYMVKRAADTFAPGIHSICTPLKNNKMVNTNVTTIANLLLKCNQKLGGINHTFIADKIYKGVLGDAPKPTTMFIGADVTHPGPTAMVDAPSIAAIVATYESTFTQYPGEVKLQRHRDENKKSLEMIADFGTMVENRLTLYAERNKDLPRIIVFVGDGVSDGQFPQVLHEEVHGGLLQACEKVYKREQKAFPKVVVLVAQKRHHTRFYQDPNEPTASKAFDQKGNPLPGLVVDTKIVSASNYDWYLTSHNTIQGTSRPSKYTILYDTLGMQPDQLQLLMFHMCYTMGRATKAIGIHPAARYADLLCNRARLYLRDVYNSTPNGLGVRPTYDPKKANWVGSIAGSLRNTMFYI